MHALELSILLHRALEARVEYLMGLLRAPEWWSDPEALHRVRVGTRRVRSVLDLVRPELYPGFKRHGRKVKELTRALGLPRELDVHALYLDFLAAKVPGLATGSALEHALEVLEARRAKARRAMVRALPGNPLVHLGDLLRVPTLQDPFLPGDLATDAWRALQPLLERVYVPVPDLLDREDPVALHGLRIRVKRLRYTLEVLGEAFLRPPEAELHHLKDLQTALGEHHDRIMLEALLQELYEGLAGRNRKTLALGTLEVLAYVGEARLNAFDRFRTLAAGMRPAEAGDALRRGLGLPGEPLP